VRRIPLLSIRVLEKREGEKRRQRCEYLSVGDLQQTFPVSNRL